MIKLTVLDLVDLRISMTSCRPPKGLASIQIKIDANDVFLGRGSNF